MRGGVWGVFLIAFAALAILASLVLGWPILVALIIAAIVATVGGGGALMRRAREKPGPPTSDRARAVSEVREPSEAAAAETPRSTG
jgi:hypothetical protein